jgi:hypothetical protein
MERGWGLGGVLAGLFPPGGGDPGCTHGNKEGENGYKHCAVALRLQIYEKDVNAFTADF